MPCQSQAKENWRVYINIRYYRYKDHFIIIKGSIHPEDIITFPEDIITFIFYALNNKSLNIHT